MAGDLDIETLRLLVAVGERGSLSAAAADCGISQPAASARVKEFEARWRLGVVRRSSRGSQLTTDGEAVVSWARAVLHGADTMRAALTALTEERRGGLAVAASLTVAEQVLPRWLGELHERRPEVRPVLQVVNSETVAAAVRAGVADLGFIESTELPLGLARRTVGRDRLVVVAAPSHRWARRRTPVTREELRREKWVLRERGSGTRGTFEGALQAEPRIALEGGSTTSLVGAAVAGVGPAVLSALSVRAEVETGRLRIVPTELDLLRPLTAVWRSDERINDAAADLLLIAVEASRQPS
ncbi:LysR family transcriptional regulator [Nocardioides hungaricus]